MAKKYQRKTRRSRRKEPEDLKGRASVTEGTVQLSLPIAELLAGVQDSLESLAGEAGMLMMKALLEDEVDQLVGDRYAHDPDRRAVRHGREDGFVVFAGKKVPVRRPRVRSLSGEEVPLERYRMFQDGSRMEGAVSRRVVRGVSTRKYEGALDAFCDGYGVQRSSVSRQWKAATHKQLKELLEQPLGELDLVAVMIDGVEFQETCLVVALGFTSDGTKKVLGLWQGATENTTVCKALLDDLVGRGLRTDQPYLFVLDGSKALHKAVRSVFGRKALVQRCLVHYAEQQVMPMTADDPAPRMLVRRIAS